MKTIKELITVKDYCSKNKISDTAARKQITANKIESVVLDGITYIVIENNDKEKLKATLKLKNKEIQALKAKAQYFEDQKETIKKLEEKIEKMEDRIEKEREKKDEIYEKIFGELSNQTKLLKMG